MCGSCVYYCIDMYKQCVQDDDADCVRWCVEGAYQHMKSGCEYVSQSEIYKQCRARHEARMRRVFLPLVTGWVRGKFYRPNRERIL